MNCPKCNRKVTANREACIYCGESVTSSPSTSKDFQMTREDKLSISNEHEETTTSKLSDLPPNIQAKINRAFSKGQNELTIEDNSEIIDYRSDIISEKSHHLSKEKALALILGIKSSYEQNKIKLNEYEHMILDILKRYIVELDDIAKINFLVHEIPDSQFSDLLTDDMIKNLMASILKT